MVYKNCNEYVSDWLNYIKQHVGMKTWTYKNTFNLAQDTQQSQMKWQWTQWRSSVILGVRRTKQQKTCVT